MGYPNHRLSGINPLAYMGVNPVTPPLLVVLKRNPLSTDTNFDIGTVWLNEDVESVFMLASLEANVATWVQLFPHPTGGTDFVTDSGTAVETGGIINILGDGGNITTSATAPNTVHVNMSSSPTFNGLVVNGNETVTGNLLVGGTPTFSALGRGVVQSSSLGVLSSSEGTDGQLLIGSSIGAPAWHNLTSSDSSITITNGHNSVDLIVNSGPVTAIPTFNYYQSTNLVLTSNVEYLLGARKALTKIIDTGSNVFPGDGLGSQAIFTAPSTGNYYLQCNILIALGTGSPLISLIDTQVKIITTQYVFSTFDGSLVTSSNVVPKTTGFGNRRMISISTVCPMTAGDTAQFSVIVTSSSDTINLVNGTDSPSGFINTYMCGHLII